MAKKDGGKKKTAYQAKPDQLKAKKEPRQGKATIVVRTALVGVPDLPAPGSWVLAHAGTPPKIFVRTTGWATGDRVWAKIHQVVESPPAPTDPVADGFQELPANSTNREGRIDIPGSVSCANMLPVENNIAVSIVYRESGAAPQTLLLGRIQFKYICPTFSVRVPAHACPWFAFRQDDVGPTGEDISTHRPVRVRIPVNAVSVAISATGWWRHAPMVGGMDTGASGPQGKAGVQPLAKPEYRTESANFSAWPLIDLPDGTMPGVNTLVGVPEPKTTTTAPKVLVIGSSASLSTPNNFRAIHLGHWDGTQWNKANSPLEISNSGEVTAVFTWAPPA